MKILIITNHSYMLYRFRRELIQQLQKEHDVVLAMPFVGHEEDFQAMGLRCIRTDIDRRGINPFTDLKLLQHYRKILKAEKPELVITYSIKPNIYAGLVCSWLKIPFCANVQGLGTAFHTKGLAQFVTALYKAAFRKVKMVFFENQGNARDFFDRKIISENKITVLPGAGINLEAYPFVSYPKNEKCHFLYLGRIMREKGIDELFSAIRRLHTERAKEFHLDLVGFFDDDYEEAVNALVADGIATFHGFQTDPQPFYAAADCIILPSYHEGLSNVLLEAAATGRPVITSNIHGCMEAVIEGESGLLCQPGNADSLYEAMKTFLALHHEEKASMGRRGREHMQAQFDKKIVVARTLDGLGL